MFSLNSTDNGMFSSKWIDWIFGESAKVVKLITAINHTDSFSIGFGDGTFTYIPIWCCFGKNSSNKYLNIGFVGTECKAVLNVLSTLISSYCTVDCKFQMLLLF